MKETAEPVKNRKSSKDRDRQRESKSKSGVL